MKLQKKKFFFDCVSLKGNVASSVILDFALEIKRKRKKKFCGNIQRQMTLEFHNITNKQLFSIMSSSDAMFDASSVYFQYVNERPAHVKINRVDLGRSKSLISLVVGWLSTTGVL